MTTLLLVLACTGEKEPQDSSPPEETAVIDTSDSAVETGDSVPIDTDTDDTGETAVVVIDNDLDGVSPDDGDCNDADATVYPGAPETVCDGVDNDCDGLGEDDAFLIGDVRYTDLATVVAAAVDGDVIDVCPGIWVGNITLVDPITLTFRGTSNVDTEISGNSLAPVFTLSPGVSLTLEDIAITDGVAVWENETYRQAGGGIWADQALITLRGTRFENNSSQDQGGGIALILGDDTSGLVVEDATFTDNRASDNGGAIAVFGDGSQEVSFTRSTFSANRAPAQGGAIYVENATGIVTECVFDVNAASGNRSYGGALGGGGASALYSIELSTFTGNTAGNAGAAISLNADASEIVISESTFTTNNAAQSGGVVRVSSDAMEVEITDSTLSQNLSSTNGGVLFLDGGGTAYLSNLTVEDNSAGNAGGAFYFDEGDGLTLNVNIVGGSFIINRAGIGGGGAIYATGARVEAVATDMGSGTDTNTPEDVYGCSQDFETTASFIFDESTGSFCVQ